MTEVRKLPWYVAALVCLGALVATAGSTWHFGHFALEGSALQSADFAALAAGDLHPLVPQGVSDLPRAARLLVYWPDAAAGAEPDFAHGLSLLCAVLAGLALWLLLWRCYGDGWSCLAGTALVLAHPLLTEHAAWIELRPELVALLLSFTCLAGLARCWQSSGGGWLAAIFCGALAMLLQPLALALPFMAGALAWLLAARGRGAVRASRWWPILALGVLAAALLWLHASAGEAHRGGGLEAGAPSAVDCVRASRHLRDLVLPWPLVLHGTVSADGWVIWIGSTFLGACAVLVFLLRRRAPAVAAAGAFIGTALLPLMLGLGGDSQGFASRQGVFLLPGLGLLAGLVAAGRSPRFILTGFLPLVLVLGGMAFLHARSFADVHAALHDGAEHEPRDAWYPLARAVLPVAPGANAADNAREADLRLAFRLAQAADARSLALRAEALLAECLLRSGRAPEAATHLAHVLASTPEESPAWRAAGLSVQALRRREVEVLLSAGEEALAESAAVCLLQRQTAAEDCLLAGRILLRSALRTLAGGVGDARTPELRARVEEALKLLARAAESPDAEVSAPALLARGSGLVAAEWLPQHLTAAQEVQLDLARRFPGRAEPLLLSSDLRALGGDRQGSLRDLLQALERNVRDLQLFARAARELMSVGENRRAVAILRLGLRVDPRAEDLRTLLAELLLAQGRQSQGAGDHARALRAAEEALQLLPDVAEGEALRGDALMSLGRWETAEASLRRALELGPELSDARRGMARFLQARGLGALADLKSTLAVTPEAERSEREQIIRDQVLADFRRALELGGDWIELALARRHVLGTEQAEKLAAATAILTRGKAELKSGNAVAARELARQAVRVHGALPEASLLLARTERACGDGAAALAAFENVLRFDPDQLEALFEAARLQAAAGNAKEAKRRAQHFLALTGGDFAPDFKQERELLQQLVDGGH